MHWFGVALFVSMVMILTSCGGGGGETPQEAKVSQLSLEDWCGAEISDYATSRIDEIPDFCQTDQTFGVLPNGGREYCVPTAVSNSLMWLCGNGYPHLGSDSGDPDRDQFEMIRQLGADYLHTDPETGTHLYYLLYGVRDYLADHGYRGELSFQGWLYHTPEFASGIEVPRLQCLLGALDQGHSVWLFVGFYDRKGEFYHRIGSHMVTAVGYDADGDLIVHDPSPRDGHSFAHRYVRPQPLAGGTLDGAYHGLPRSAAGFHRLDGIARPAGVDLAVLDGFVLLSMLPAGP